MAPFTFFSGLFGNFARRARQDVYESRETALWQFSRIFEQRLGDVENLAIAISKLSEVNAVRRVGREVTGMDIYKIYLLQRSMHAIRMQQSFIQSIYIYLDSHRAAPSGYPHQQVQGGEHLPGVSVPAVHVGLREPGDAVFIVINTKSLRELLAPSLQAILGQALRGRSPRSSRRANRSPTALYWTTTGSVCCCSAAPKGWAGSNTDPGNGSSSGKQLGLFRIACTKVALLLIFEADGRTEEKLFRSAQKASDGVIGCSPQVFFGCNSLHDDLQSLVKEAESALEYGQLAGYRGVFFDKMALSFPLRQAEGLNRAGKAFPSGVRGKNAVAALEQLLEGCSDQNAVCARFACGYLSDLLILAMAETASCGGNRSIVIIQRVMAYIDDNYAKLNLFVTMIAEENDASPSCLAQIFKKKDRSQHRRLHPHDPPEKRKAAPQGQLGEKRGGNGGVSGRALPDPGV